MTYVKKISAFILVLLFTFSISLTAQNESQSTSEPRSDQTPQNTRVDTVNSTPAIVVDTAGQNSHNQIARDMAIKLLQKTNITFEQAGEVEEILIDYQSDIAEAKNRGTTTATDQSVTDTETGTETDTDEDNNEMLGGMGNDANLSEIDRETNSKIEDVFDDDQMNTYLFVKEDWWNELKAKVYGTEDQDNQGMQNDQNQDLNNQQNTDENQDINNQQNTNPNPDPGQSPDADQDQNPNPDQDQNPNPDNEQGMDTDTSPDTGREQDHNESAPADSLNR